MRPRVWRIGLLAVFFAAALAIEAGAIRRGTPEQLDSKTKPFEEYLKDIRANWRDVETLILKRAKVDTETAIKRFSELRDGTEKEIDKAVCDYLIARAYFWQAFHEFKATHKPEVFARLRPKLLDADLALSHRLLALEEPSAADAAVRTEMLRAVVATFSTNIWGMSLSADEKARVVKEFIEPLENSPLVKTVLPRDRMTQTAYTNLGIADRFVEGVLPAELPEDYSALSALFKKEYSLLSLERKWQIVNVLERDHAEALAHDAGMLVYVGGVYLHKGERETGLKYNRRAAELHPYYNRNLYRLSLRPEMGIDAKEREGYLEAYLCTGVPDADAKDSKKSTRSQIYGKVVDFLLMSKHFDEALELTERWRGDKQCVNDTPTEAQRLSFEGQCLEKLGRTAAARETYNRYIKTAVPTHKYRKQRAFIFKRLVNLKGNE